MQEFFKVDNTEGDKIHKIVFFLRHLVDLIVFSFYTMLHPPSIIINHYFLFLLESLKSTSNLVDDQLVKVKVKVRIL